MAVYKCCFYLHGNYSFKKVVKTIHEVNVIVCELPITKVVFLNPLHWEREKMLSYKSRLALS